MHGNFTIFTSLDQEQVQSYFYLFLLIVCNSILSVELFSI